MSENTISTKNNMKKAKIQLIVLINYTENLYKIMYLIEVNMKVYVIFLLNMLMKTKINLFDKPEHKNKNKFL